MSRSSNSNGNWLVGPVATDHLCKLGHALFEKYLERIETGYGSRFVKYQPWMSCTDKGHQLLRHFAMKQRSSSVVPEIISNNEDLKVLSQTFKGDQEDPFGALGYPARNFRMAENKFEIDSNFVKIAEESISLIRQASIDLSKQMDMFMLEIIPLVPFENAKMREMGSGLSLHWYKGGIFVAPPRDFLHRNLELAINLVHELGHQTLMIYQCADPLIESDLISPIYSAVRKTERPAIMSFHAAVALIYMSWFLVEYLHLSPLETAEKAYAEKRLQECLSDLDSNLVALENVKLSPLGIEIAKEAAGLLRKWR